MSTIIFRAADIVVSPAARAGDPRVVVTQARRTFDDPADDRVLLSIIYEDSEENEAVDAAAWRAALVRAVERPEIIEGAGCCSECDERGLQPGHFACSIPPAGYRSGSYVDGGWTAERIDP